MTRLFDPTNFKKKMEARGFRCGWLRDEEVPYRVDFPGFTRDILSDDAYRRMVIQRRAWCFSNVTSPWDSVPLRAIDGTLMGLTYRFGDANEAMLFVLAFDWAARSSG